MEDYRTIHGTATGEYEEKKSRFIAALSFADSEEAAVAFLEQVRAANRTARHNVYAYRLREGNRERYSDDGEPAKTAGTPALEVLQHSGLTDLIVVVTRYFGGVLLGTGGLVRAYSRSAAAAIQEAGEVAVLPALRYHITIPYNRYGGLEALLRERAMVEAVDFGQDVQVTALVEAAQAPGFCKAVTEKSDGRCTPALLGEGWLRRPCPPRD